MIVNYRQFSFFQAVLTVKEQKKVFGGSCAAAQDKR